MSNLRIKPEYKSKTVSFGSYSGPAGAVKGNDLLDLGIIAAESKDPTLTRLFVKLPELSELKKQKMDIALGRTETVTPEPHPAALVPPVPSEMKAFAGKAPRKSRAKQTPSNAPAAI